MPMERFSFLKAIKNQNYNTGAKPNTMDSIRGPRCKSRPLEVWQRWKSHKSEKTASLTNGVGETGYLHAEEKTFILLSQHAHKSTTNVSKRSVL